MFDNLSVSNITQQPQSILREHNGLLHLGLFSLLQRNPIQRAALCHQNNLLLLIIILLIDVQSTDLATTPNH